MERIPEINKEVSICTMMAVHNSPASCEFAIAKDDYVGCQFENDCDFRRTAMLKITFVEE